MKLLNKNIWLLLGIITIIELVSFLGYFYLPLKIISAIVISLIIFIVCLKNLENGLLILFTELIIGSKGHLFELGPVSIRMIIFVAIILSYLIKLRKSEERLKIISYLKEFKEWLYFIVLAIFISLALVVALVKGNNLSNIFSDFNAWPFFLLLFPVLAIYFKANKETYEKLIQVLIGAFLWLGVETLTILYIFTHNISVMPDLYYFLRRTGVAEITPTLGSWPRIFLQSQIYATIALVMMPFILKIKKWQTWALMTLAWSICFLSMSRSFWLAIVIVFALGVFTRLILKGWRKIGKSTFLITGSALASVLLILFISLFPIPKPGNFSANSFINRISFDASEAAVASRWSLLPVLWQEIKESVFIGSGFGKTITYKSSDPRVLENNPSGEYTTYAFEWGYLALWLKFGLFGLIAYLSLLGIIIYRGILRWRNGDNLAGALALGLLVLAFVHFFTPYLDHPLGIAYLILAVVLMESRPRLEKSALS